jgi:histidinol-phosphate aminotransferase
MIGKKKQNTWLNYANPSLSNIQPYEPGKPESQLIRELNLSTQQIVKLNSNESLWEAAPAIKHHLSNIQNIHSYPDGNGFELKQTIAKLHNISPQHITLGNGSNDILELIARAFLCPNTSAIYAQHSFIVYHLVTLTQQARGIKVPASNYGHNLTAMLQAIEKETKIIFIANPNNPTGTFIPYEQIKDFLKAVPKHILVVLDEAYYDYLPKKEQEDSIAWLEEFANLIIVRTLSKIYGLASLRLGYALSHPDLSDLFNRVRPPFNTNTIAQECGVIALQEQDFIQEVASQTLIQKTRLESEFNKLNIRYIPSLGNFLCTEFADAPYIHQKLSEHGILVRPIGGYELPNHLRITVGQERDNKRLLKILEQLL